jgi:hypothetical protein
MNSGHSVRFAVDYPDRELNRFITAFCIWVGSWATG